MGHWRNAGNNWSALIPLKICKEKMWYDWKKSIHSPSLFITESTQSRYENGYQRTRKDIYLMDILYCLNVPLVRGKIRYPVDMCKSHVRGILFWARKPIQIYAFQLCFLSAKTSNNNILSLVLSAHKCANKHYYYLTTRESFSLYWSSLNFNFDIVQLGENY